MREIVRNLQPGAERTCPGTSPPAEEPAADPAELYGLIPTDFRQQVDPRELIARIVDGSRFHEFKALYGETLVCGFARIEAYPVGILANNGVLFGESAREGRALRRARLQAEGAARLPAEHHRVHGRQGVRGRRDRARRREARDRGRLRGGAEVHRRRSAARSARGNYGMCGRAYSPRQLWMWPNARISVMGGEQAATVLTMVGDADPDEIRAKYEARGQPVLLDRAALGRRDHRPARHAPRAGARDLGRAERADPRDDLRRLQDVADGLLDDQRRRDRGPPGREARFASSGASSVSRRSGSTGSRSRRTARATSTTSRGRTPGRGDRDHPRLGRLQGRRPGDPGSGGHVPALRSEDDAGAGRRARRDDDDRRRRPPRKLRAEGPF